MQALNREVIKTIRTAFKAGRKTFEIDGIMYKVRRWDHQARFQMGGESHSRTERWLIAERVDGGHAPRYQIELTESCNTRSIIAKGSTVA